MNDSIRWRFIDVEVLSVVVFVLCALGFFGGLALFANANSINTTVPGAFGEARADVIRIAGGAVMLWSLFGMLFAGAVRVLVDINRHLERAARAAQATAAVNLRGKTHGPPHASAALAQQCPSCGANNAAASQFCESCGTRLTGMDR